MPNAEVRESSTAEFLIQRDFGTGATRIYWVRDIVRLKFRPYPTLYKYSEILSGGTGYVDGIDSSTPTALTKLIDPPGSPMSSIRTIVTQRELMREPPRFLHDMKNNLSALEAIGDVIVDGKVMPAVRFNVAVPGVQTEVGDWQFILIFDPVTGLPARVRTLDGDPIQGTTKFALVLMDWRGIDGGKIPFPRMHKHKPPDPVEKKNTE